jgi:hypothetical protein
MADHKPRMGARGRGEAGLQPSLFRDVNGYRRFHGMTLRFPRQIIKGAPTSKLVEVYFPLCGA